MRARRGEAVCSVCFLIACLAEEHAAGEHARPNASCKACVRLESYRSMYAADIPPETPQRVRQTLVPGTATGRLTTYKPEMQHVPMDHSRCDHEKTSKARAACRRARAADSIAS